MDVFNSSLEIGAWINHATLNVTGNTTITLLLLFFFILLIAMLFKEPLVLFALIVLPLIYYFAEYDASGFFYTVLAIIGIIIGWQVMKILFGWGR